MIKEIRLKNWKSFRDAVLPIDPLTILIGANASGKSNAIDALEFLERIAYGKELRPALAGDSTLAPIRGGVEGAVLQGEKSLTIATMLGKNSFTIETLIGDDEGNDYIHSITVNIDSKVQLDSEYLFLTNEESKEVRLIIQNILNKKELKENLSNLYFIIKNSVHYLTEKAKKIEEYLKTIDFFVSHNYQVLLDKYHNDEIFRKELLEALEDESFVKYLINCYYLLYAGGGCYLDYPSIYVNFDDSELESLARSIAVLWQAKNFIYDDEDIIALDTVIENFQNIFILDPIPSKMRNYRPLAETLERDGSNIAGVLAGLSEEKKKEIEEALSHYASALPEREIKRVWAETVGRFNSDAMLYCEEEWIKGTSQIIDAKGMSDGTLRFLAILTALLTRPEGTQIIIEEIDNGLHPSRAKLLLQALKEIGTRRKIDILVTTHNPALLDALPIEMMPFVIVAHRDIETGESKLTPLNEIENLPKLMAGGTLGKITMQGALERSLERQGKKEGNKE